MAAELLVDRAAPLEGGHPLRHRSVRHVENAREVTAGAFEVSHEGAGERPLQHRRRAVGRKRGLRRDHGLQIGDRLGEAPRLVVQQRASLSRLQAVGLRRVRIADDGGVRLHRPIGAALRLQAPSVMHDRHRDLLG